MGSQGCSRKRAVRGVVLAGGVLLSWFLAFPEQVPAQSGGGVERWLGCYALERDRWEPPLPENLREADPLLYQLYQPPSRTELTADSAAGFPAPPPPKAFDHQLEESAEPHPFEVTAWRPAGGDTLEIWWSNGFSGTGGRFVGTGDTLRGTLETFNDFGQPKYHAKARLIAVPCSESAASGGLGLKRSETARLTDLAYTFQARRPSRPPRYVVVLEVIAPQA